MTIIIKVAVMPGRAFEVPVEPGTTLKTVLESAGVQYNGYEVRKDGVIVEDINETVDSDTSLVTLIAKIKGNK